MIITCPNCHTRYKVASDALSAAGRQVQCAACSELWYATPTFPRPLAPEPDPEPTDDELAFRSDRDISFSEDEEALLDEAFLRAEPVEPSPPAPAPLDRAGNSARLEALARRRRGMLAKLPIARFRRAFRVTIALALVGLVAGAITLRTEIVSAFPQLDGLYRLVGLGTNVVGLDFTDINTLRTTRDGTSVIIVNAKISNITNQLAYVPSVLVSLLNASGTVIYEWTVTPAARNILPGDVLAIDTQLTAPPQGVTNVRLSFVDGRNGAGAGTTQ
ncbi:zinc-ribbon domain-containing protein [Pelagibacterium mangrovi]|uniref:zinc-ribbon domain-containing protein n=1 Tax=Pelagibacterium mangrovi TaxID=3119828 RepID=UPI002FC7972D